MRPYMFWFLNTPGAIVCIVLSVSVFTAQSQESADVMWQKAEAASERQDYATQLKLCTALATQADVRGQACLGAIYDTGVRGIPKNEKEALKWWRMAAEQGDAYSEWILARYYHDGKGGASVNKTECAKLLRLAADQGLPESQFDLAILYFDGNGVLQDYVQAYMWVNLAIANPHHKLAFRVSQMTNMRNQVARRMTRDQITEAQRLARDWKAKVNKVSCTALPELCAI